MTEALSMFKQATAGLVDILRYHSSITESLRIDVGQLHRKCDALAQDHARLRAEVERMKHDAGAQYEAREA